MKKKNPTVSKKKNSSKGTTREYMESFIVALGIALLIRALIIYPFRIPTGSMQSSLLIGDFLLANKFVYGIRTPDWIGIPYTKIGFKVPFFRTPGFRKPKPGDVVIFKYPRDESLNYIKRCIAVSGDTVEVRNKRVYVNGDPFPDAEFAQYGDNETRSDSVFSWDIFPPHAGNRDNYGPVRVPAPGDTFRFTDHNRDKWYEHFQLILYEGHKMTRRSGNRETKIDVETLTSWWFGHFQTPWSDPWKRNILDVPIDHFRIDGKPLKDLVYRVKNRHYFMMGDNRDFSLDSRYWGYLPERYVVGEALIIYWSWDKEIPMYRLFNKIRWNRLLNLIH